MRVDVLDLLLLLELLQGILNRFAPLGRLGEPVAGRLDHRAVGVGLLDRLEALLGVLLVGDVVEQEGIGDGAGAATRQRDECQDHAIQTEHQRATLSAGQSACFSMASSACY